jgi:hypothetical protein
MDELARVGISSTYEQRPATISPWSQLGGAANHSASSPLSGPRVLAPSRFIPFPNSAQRTATQIAPVVISRREQAYALLLLQDRLELLVTSLQAADPVFASTGLSLSGQTQYPPVITPQGWIVAGSSSGQVTAWDPEAQKIRWAKDLGSSVYALTSSPDGMLYASTASGLIALNADSTERWRQEQAKDLQAPVTCLDTGELLVVSRSGELLVLDSQGQSVQPTIAWKGSPLLLPAVACSSQGYLLGQAGDWGRFNRQGLEPLSSQSGQGLSTLPAIYRNGQPVYATGNTVVLAERSFQLHLRDTITALACDGSGAIFAAIKGTIFRIDPQDAQTRPDFSEVKSGEVLRAGIAILHNRLLVTTSTGIQVFE